MSERTELQMASEIADAELGVAEELGWPLAVLAATSVHLWWSSWLVTLATVGLGYYFATLKYRRKSAVAEDRYCREAGLGKYAKQGNNQA